QEGPRPAGTPEDPIGRGHPFPPPGTPLPTPERFTSKRNHPLPKRKPVPVQSFREHSKPENKRTPASKPSTPKRKPVANSDLPEGQQQPVELLVVEAPEDSCPNSPATEVNENADLMKQLSTDDVSVQRDNRSDRNHDLHEHNQDADDRHHHETLIPCLASERTLHEPGRNRVPPFQSNFVMSSRTEADLAINIRKATNIEETAPKRKHVRACIVYTWDNRSSAAFWAGMKVQPILADEIQTFKALITIHKVLQEGHPIVIKEAQQHVNWLDTLMRGVGGEGIRGYAPLIREYVFFLESKLHFHRNHPEFNGLFEYEEYISLKTINDPNEGYETISDLMTLQDQIDAFQKLIFSHFLSGTNNECRISALVPLVQESYGIYKFITSMLRAMHTTTGDAEALEPLRARYDAQHYRLVRFYYECSNLRYLTSLITVPKLPQDPPNLFAEDEDRPALPKRPAKEIEREPTPPPAKVEMEEPEPIADFWTNEAKRQQEEYEAEQRRIQQQWEDAQRQQLLAQQQAQRDFEEQQRIQAEQARLAQEQLLREQYQSQTQGRLAELERENLNARAQYEQDQLMLQQYDRRVKDLEEQMNQLTHNVNLQNASKDDQIRALQEQVNTWRSKYEALAKLYSQLRQEHLDLLQTTKGLKLKAASAQEAIERRERLEREIKTKNLELADMIRERDRALHERDRLTGTNKEELEKVKRELRMAIDRAENAERQKGTEISTLLSKYNREMADLEEALRNKNRALEEALSRNSERQGDQDLALREKDEEIEVYKSGMEQALMELEELKLTQGDADQALDTQIDHVLHSSISKINDIIDSVLQTGVQRVDDALYELDSSMQAGNQNASPPYVLSQIEKASASATEFSTAFNNFIADGPNSTHAEIIRTVSIFSGSISDVLSNTKGLTRFANDDRSADQLINSARKSAQATVWFFRGLQSFRLEGLEPLQKTDVVINNNLEVQQDLQSLSKLVDTFAPKGTKISTKGDLSEMVDQELSKAADAIDAAAQRLAKLKKKPREGYTTYELRIHDSIVEAALAVTNAIAELIKAATATQEEIVREGRGSSSRTAFYKKNNRWTEGLISAAKAVASSTNTLIETADGVISGRNSPEQLIVASNDVAASTAQLVAASRVKASFMSKTQDRLETASKAVGAACRALVRQVQDIIAERNRDEGETVDYSKLSSHEFKVREMEQQVEILQLENNLARARQRLGEMRKISYQED
ncbi:sla2 Src-like adaptor 2, partial [Monascus purpureus]